MAAGLNIIGLSVAFTAFLVIMMQVDYDRRFDRCHPKAGRIFLAELCDSVMANGRVIYPGAFQGPVQARHSRRCCDRRR